MVSNEILLQVKSLGGRIKYPVEVERVGRVGHYLATDVNLLPFGHAVHGRLIRFTKRLD